MKALLFLLLLVPLSGAATAHDLWIEAEGDGLVLYRGHHHSGHAGADRVPYPPDHLRSALCANADGRVTPAVYEPAYPVRFAVCPALLVRFSSGHWSRTVHGTVNRPASGLEGVLRSWLSVENVKRLDRWSAAFAQPLTSELEIVPLHDPFVLRPGDKLRLRVTYHGRPRAGVTVAYEGDPRAVTDSAGNANIRLRHTGRQAISTGLETPLEDGMADRTLHAATLLFELPAH